MMALVLLSVPTLLCAVPVDQTFTYDALNRLTTAAGGGYNYDAAGNLLSITGPPPTKPSGPSPANGSSGASRLPTLAWAAAQNASGLTLYFSTDSNLSGATQVPLAGNATVYNFLSTLPYNTTIWWRVDAFNGAGQTTTGDVWSFTTLANTTPTLSAITDKSTNEDVTISGIAFTIGDGEAAPGALTIEVTSGSTSVVPNGNLTLSGSGSSRSLSIKPAPDAFGSSLITVKVTDDGGFFTTRQFTLTVISVNDLPIITTISNGTIEEDQPAGTGAIDFTIGDVETSPANLTVTATSSNTALVPNLPANLVLGGSGSTRTLTVVPAPNAFGTSTIFVRVVDAVLGERATTFVLTVNAVNDAPTITGISEQAILPDTSTGTLSFTVSDVETAAASLTLSKNSSNPALVPLNNIVFGGSGSNRSVTVTPVAGQTGQSTITVSVSDGVLITPMSFLLRVTNNNANLASLTLSSGTLSPGFASATTNYTAAIGNSIPSITITPTVADSNATVRVNGTLVSSGSASSAIPLAVGSNPAITILVTAQDGMTKTYTVTPTRNPLPSATTLAATAIATTTATLHGTVNAEGVSANVSFRYGPTAAYGSTVTATPSPVTVSSATAVSALLTGLNPGQTYHYQVVAANSTDSQSGSDLTFTTLSDNARLSSLALSAGFITFDPDNSTYSTTVANSVSSLTLTPTVQQGNATLTIQGNATPSGIATLVALTVGENVIPIVVTAQDGVSTRTYTLTALRNPIPVAETSAATNITALAATLNGTINAGGVSTSVIFEYGTSAAYGQTATATPATVSSVGATSVSAALTNLTPGTLYHYRAKGTNSTDNAAGDALTFTTLRNNANLASLTVSAGTLTFAPATTSYNVSVPNAVISVTVIPTVADSSASVKVNNTTVTSGTASPVIALTEGINPAINILVTAEDGTAKNYSVIYERLRLPVLSGIAFDRITKSSARLSGTVNARGSSTTTTVEYSLDINFANFTSVPANPPNNNGATDTAVQGNLTGLIPATTYYARFRATSLAGEQVSNAVSFATTANDAFLISLVPSQGVLTPTLSAGNNLHTVNVAYSVGAITFTPTATTAAATITVNGSSVTSGAASLPVTLSTGDNAVTIVVTDAEAGAARTYTITVVRPVGPPVFDSQIPSRFVFQGSSVTLTPQISGAATLRYYWRKNGSLMSGITQPDLAIPSMGASQVGRYSLRVENDLGAATSQDVFLGMITPVAAGINVIEGGTLSLTVKAAAPTGVTLVYQWWKGAVPLSNGGRISGAGTATLKITGMTPDDQDDYWCYVSMRAANGTEITGLSAAFPTVTLTFLPEILAGPLPDASVSVAYAAAFPANSDPQKKPVSYAATGLPPGLKCDAKTGLISGRPTAARKDRFGQTIPYDVTLTARNAKGNATRKTTLWVEPLPEHAVGVFAAPLGRDAALNEGLGGRFDITVLSTGLFSGKATLGTVSWPFNGVLEGGDEPAATVSIKRKIGQLPLKASFRITSGTRMLGNGVLTDDTATLNFIGWRKALPVQASDFTGYHTFGILPPAGVADVPRGTGYGSFTVSKTGTLTLAGKTADGESITGGAFVGVGGDIVIYQILYTTKLKGSLQGSLDIDHLGSANAENTLEGTVSWSRPENTALTARLFALGFGPEDFSIAGGGYVPPNATAGEIVMSLSDLPGNAAILFDPNSSEGPPFEADLVVRIRPGGAVERLWVNPAKTTLSITPTTGAFRGTFALSDVNPLPAPASPRLIARSVVYQGLIFRQNGGWSGAGYFLMPKLPSPEWPSTSKTPIIPGNVYLGSPF